MHALWRLCGVGLVSALLTSGCGGGTSSTQPTASSSTGSADERSVSLGTGGKLMVGGTDVSALPYQDAIARLTDVLGPPTSTTPVGRACETQISPGYAVEWKNFRALVQTQDSPDLLGSSRKGHIAGWSLSGWVPEAEQLSPAPTLSGVTIGSTSTQARAAFPDAREEPGPAGPVLTMGDGADPLGGTRLYLDGKVEEARVQFIDSGYSCGD